MKRSAARVHGKGCRQLTRREESEPAWHPRAIQSFVEQTVATAPARYDDLRAVVFEGTLKRSPEPSHTAGLLEIPLGIMEGVGVRVDRIRTVDHDIPPGNWPDMREHGWETDEFPAIYHELVVPADIIILAGPIWLGDQSSMTRKIIERLYAYSGEVNDKGQWAYYGKVGAAVTTGNEDGGKHVSAQVLYTLQHIGLTVPPQSDVYWNGEAGPGPSYLDGDAGGTGTRGRPATRRSWPGTCSTWRGCSRTRAATRATATTPGSGTSTCPSTPTRNTAERSGRTAHAIASPPSSSGAPRRSRPVPERSRDEPTLP